MADDTYSHGLAEGVRSCIDVVLEKAQALTLSDAAVTELVEAMADILREMGIEPDGYEGEDDDEHD